MPVSSDNKRLEIILNESQYQKLVSFAQNNNLDLTEVVRDSLASYIPGFLDSLPGRGEGKNSSIESEEVDTLVISSLTRNLTFELQSTSDESGEKRVLKVYVS